LLKVRYRFGKYEHENNGIVVSHFN